MIKDDCIRDNFSVVIKDLLPAKEKIKIEYSMYYDVINTDFAVIHKLSLFKFNLSKEFHFERNYHLYKYGCKTIFREFLVICNELIYIHCKKVTMQKYIEIY